MWFAWKYLPLWYQQQRIHPLHRPRTCCDLLKNIYLCGINNNWIRLNNFYSPVVICLKISTFVVSTTTKTAFWGLLKLLWFAWKYLPLWYQQQRIGSKWSSCCSCDLLENIYLCGINNNIALFFSAFSAVVICLKISTFVVSTTTSNHRRTNQSLLWFAWKYLPLWYQQQRMSKLM